MCRRILHTTEAWKKMPQQIIVTVLCLGGEENTVYEHVGIEEMVLIKS